MTAHSRPALELVATVSAARGGCRDCAVRSLAVCSAFTGHQLKLLQDILIARSHKRGELVSFNECELGQVAILTEGVLKLTRVLADGRELTVDLLFPGAVLGLCGEAEQHTEAWAITDASLCYIAKAKFRRLVEEHPELEHELLKLKLKQLDKARDRMVSLGRKSATERLATFFLEVAEHMTVASCDHGNDAPLEFELLMARRVIADYLGLSIECVSRKVQQFARDGVISVREHNHITIQNFQALRRLSGD
jgi:CRP/FNR family transcriptional regulator